MIRYEDLLEEQHRRHGGDGSVRQLVRLLVEAINHEFAQLRRELVAGIRDLPDDQIEAAGFALIAEYEKRLKGTP